MCVQESSEVKWTCSFPEGRTYIATAQKLRATTWNMNQSFWQNLSIWLALHPCCMLTFSHESCFLRYLSKKINNTFITITFYRYNSVVHLEAATICVIRAFAIGAIAFRLLFNAECLPLLSIMPVDRPIAEYPCMNNLTVRPSSICYC